MHCGEIRGQKQAMDRFSIKENAAEVRKGM
jgi:hypothetical protein